MSNSTEKQPDSSQPIEKSCFHPDKPYVAKRLVKTSTKQYVVYVCKTCVDNPLFQGEDLQ